MEFWTLWLWRTFCLKIRVPREMKKLIIIFFCLRLDTLILKPLCNTLFNDQTGIDCSISRVSECLGVWLDSWRLPECDVKATTQQTTTWLSYHLLWCNGRGRWGDRGGGWGGGLGERVQARQLPPVLRLHSRASNSITGERTVARGVEWEFHEFCEFGIVREIYSAQKIWATALSLSGALATCICEMFSANFFKTAACLTSKI